MHKISFVILTLAIFACNAEPARFRTNSRKQFARQEVETVAASTPYPTAEELKPEVPFEEVDAAVQPQNTYGPPEIEADEALPVDEPVDQEPEPEADEELDLATPVTEPAAEEFSSVELQAPSESSSSRLTAAKRGRRTRLGKLKAQRKSLKKSQRLVAAAAVPEGQLPLVYTAVPASAVGAFQQQAQPQIYLINQQPLTYSAQLQAW